MTSYVVDASAYQAAGMDHADTRTAPELIDLEVANLLRKSVLRGDRSPAEATTAFTEWIENAVQRVPLAAYLPTIWSLRHSITPYDAAYVALAMRLELPLLTADRRLAAAASAYCEVEIL